MNAFFFGPASNQIFACHHAPAGSAAGAVVICPPWGPEYQYAHRTLRSLAKRLSDRGFHVLRFDYTGTGDSAGETTAADLGRWQDDVDEAVERIRSLSGLPHADLIGLRLGAVAALRAAERRDDVRSLLLWDPVSDGSAWLQELASIYGPRVDHGNASELAATMISAAFYRQIQSISPDDRAAPRAQRILLLRTRGESTVDRSGALAGLPTLVQEHVPDVCPWVEDESVWSGLVPARAVRRMVEWLQPQ